MNTKIMDQEEIMSTTKKRKVFIPFQYDWAVKAYEDQQKMMWIVDEISLSNDLKEFYNILTDREKNVIIQTLRFFTQTDAEIARAYVDYYLPIFKNPDIRMMLLAFANMECNHAMAYKALITALQLPDIEFSKFLDFKEMIDKYDYMQSFNIEDPTGIAITLAAVSGGIEGFVLFASFAILLYFSVNRAKFMGKSCLFGVGQVIAFSIRDETLHSISIIRLFKEYVLENYNIINFSRLSKEIYSNFETMVLHEQKFIDLLFEKGDLDGLKASSLKSYINYLANIKLKQLGYEPIFENGLIINPLAWMEEFMSSDQLTNFLEQTETNYGKATGMNY